MASYAPVGQEADQAGYTAPAKKPISNWIKFGIPVFVLVAVGAILGGVLGSRAANHNSTSSASVASASAASASAAASSAASVKNDIGRFATATESDYMMPIYPSTVCIFISLDHAPR